MTHQELRNLAREGARQRVAALNQELATIYLEFPELARERGSKASGLRAVAPRVARKRPAMSAAERKAVSLRMKAYWADRRKKKAAATTAAAKKRTKKAA